MRRTRWPGCWQRSPARLPAAAAAAGVAAGWFVVGRLKARTAAARGAQFEVIVRGRRSGGREEERRDHHNDDNNAHAPQAAAAAVVVGASFSTHLRTTAAHTIGNKDQQAAGAVFVGSTADIHGSRKSFCHRSREPVLKKLLARNLRPPAPLPQLLRPPHAHFSPWTRLFPLNI